MTSRSGAMALTRPVKAGMRARGLEVRRGNVFWTPFSVLRQLPEMPAKRKAEQEIFDLVAGRCRRLVSLGRQSFHIAAWCLTTTPRASRRACPPDALDSARSPRTASRSSGSSRRDNLSTRRGPDDGKRRKQRPRGYPTAWGRPSRGSRSPCSSAAGKTRRFA